MKVTVIAFAASLAAFAPAAHSMDDAQQVGTSAAAVKNIDYIERADELVMRSLALIGVNYKFGGNTPDDGLDCSGLVSFVFQQVTGLLLPRNSQAMSKVGNKIDKTGLQPGDLVFFNTRKRPYSHVGIYIGEQRFVHAPSRGREVKVSNMRDRYWQIRYNGARRLEYAI